MNVAHFILAISRALKYCIVSHTYTSYQSLIYSILHFKEPCYMRFSYIEVTVIIFISAMRWMRESLFDNCHSSFRSKVRYGNHWSNIRKIFFYSNPTSFLKYNITIYVNILKPCSKCQDSFWKLKFRHIYLHLFFRKKHLMGIKFTRD